MSLTIRILIENIRGNLTYTWEIIEKKHRIKRARFSDVYVVYIDIYNVYINVLTNITYIKTY